MKNLVKDVQETIHREGLSKKDRRRHIVHQRMYLMNILRDNEVKLKKIGSMFNLHHATIIHLINKYKDLKLMKDVILDVDTQELQNIFEDYNKASFSIIFDLRNAHTVYDYRVIRERLEGGHYKDVENKKGIIWALTKNIRINQTILYDINNAVTRYDWSKIKERLDMGVYIDIIKQS